MARNHSKKTRIPIACILLFMCLNIWSLTETNGQNVFFIIEGERVTEDEFVFHMQQEKALCSNYFYTKYQAEQGSGFWTESFSGEIPLNYLKDKTIERIKEIKIHLILAREYGLLEDISFKSFLVRFEETNRVRKEKVEAGEIIYGPEKFSRETYFSYWYSNLVIELRKAWSRDYRISNDSLNAEYESESKFNSFIRDRIMSAELKFTSVDMDNRLMEYLPY